MRPIRPSDPRCPEPSIIMEQAVLRGTARHPVRLADQVLVGPHAHLSGCTVEDSVFVAIGACVLNGARLGAHSEVRINGVVHVNTAVPAEATVPIDWVAVGDPAQILPPIEHERIWAVRKTLEFPPHRLRPDARAGGRVHHARDDSPLCPCPPAPTVTTTFSATPPPPPIAGIATMKSYVRKKDDNHIAAGPRCHAGRGARLGRAFVRSSDFPDPSPR